MTRQKPGCYKQKACRPEVCHTLQPTYYFRIKYPLVHLKPTLEGIHLYVTFFFSLCIPFEKPSVLQWNYLLRRVTPCLISRHIFILLFIATVRKLCREENSSLLLVSNLTKNLDSDDHCFISATTSAINLLITIMPYISLLQQIPDSVFKIYTPWINSASHIFFKILSTFSMT